MKKGLNIGCGTNPSKSTEEIEFIYIDIAELEGIDMLYDLNKIPYPFEDESFDLIIMHDIIEHLEKPIDVFREVHRLLKKDGLIKLKVVDWSHRYTYSDPQHKHAFSERYFRVLTGEIRAYYLDFHFKDLKINYLFDREVIKRYIGKRFNRELNEEDKVFLLKKSYHKINFLQGMEVEMSK